MNTVVLLGTEHPIQLGENDPDAFRAVLMEECEKNKVKAIAEEISSGDNTIAATLANDLQLKYLYADPGIKERMDRGISSNIERDIINDYVSQYPEIGMWPREPGRVNLPIEVWKEYSKRTGDAYRKREKI